LKRHKRLKTILIVKGKESLHKKLHELVEGTPTLTAPEFAKRDTDLRMNSKCKLRFFFKQMQSFGHHSPKNMERITGTFNWHSLLWHI